MFIDYIMICYSADYQTRVCAKIYEIRLTKGKKTAVAAELLNHCFIYMLMCEKK